MKNSKGPGGLQITIVGAGKVGTALTEQLSREGHDITVIDKDSSTIEEITSTYDVMGYVGNGSNFMSLHNIGIESCDLFIAVTDSDELNLLCCTFAKRVSDCNTIARVRTPDYSSETKYLCDKLELAMIINPELESARDIARILYLPAALEVNSFAHGLAEIMSFKIQDDSELLGLKLSDLGSKDYMNGVLVCAVERENEIMIPTGNYEFQAGDKVSFVAIRSSLRYFLSKMHFKSKSVKNCMIVGGGNLSFYLANELIKSGISVKIIENDSKRCEELSILLPKAIIINADGTDEDLLKEEGIETVESFVPLTGIDEENILLSMHAKNTSDAKVVTKIDHVNFKSTINKLDLGSVFYPRYITSDAIIAYVRARSASKDINNIETLYHMYDSRVEAIEFRVDKKSRITEVPISQLQLKDNLLICLINRKDKLIIPSGSTKINMNDSVIIVTTHSGFNDITDILE